MAAETDYLDIPTDGLVTKTAYSMDIGGSMSKVVYTTDEGDKVRLHFASFPRPRTDEAIKLLKEKMGGRQPDGTLMDTCGVGFQEYADTIKQELNVTVNVHEELNCFIDCFYYLASRLPVKELVYQDPPEFKQDVRQVAEVMAGGINALSGKGDHWEVAEDDGLEETIQYPVLLCELGSGGGLMKIEADGSFKICEQLTRCGRTILGLTKILLRTESFSELIELATKGDASQLHIQAKHLLLGAGDVYDQVPGDFMVYCFGQAASKDPDQFKREDLAAALLGMLCEDIAQTCHLAAMAYGVKQLFLCGSVVGESPFIREQMKMMLYVKDVLNAKSERYHSFFLKFGGCYGALGALLRTIRGTDDTCSSQM